MRRAAPDRCDVLVVGAGFADAVMAERLASELGLRVLVIDRRAHVAGNAHDRVDDHGIWVHDHGPHLFHTNSVPIFEYLSHFTVWTPYEHRVLASVEGQLVPIPINQDTIDRLYGLSLDPAGVERFLAERAEPIDCVRTSEDAVVARVGSGPVREVLPRLYTQAVASGPCQLAASVTGRIPTRSNPDDRYFTDVHQALPASGYTAMFNRMLDHPNIHVALETEYEDLRDEVEFGHLVYTGPIDGFYGERFGALPYRSLRFEWTTVDTPGAAFFQPVAGQLPQRARVPAHNRVPATGRAASRLLHALLRVPGGRWRSLLPDSAGREPCALQALRGVGRRGSRRHVRRPPRALPVPQHGPGRGAGGGDVREAAPALGGAGRGPASTPR